MKKAFLLLIIFFSTKLFAQYKLHIVLTDKAPIKAERINVAGSFNGWNPDDVKYQFTKREETWELTLGNVENGIHQFKCTQGSWETVEDSASKDITNRIINLHSDTTIYITTYGWKRVGDSKPGKHTASVNVHVISDSFYMPQLKRKRKVWIYLPSNYTTSTQKYPVLYMQDAQNLFDEFTAPFGEWNVDETLDSLQKQTGKFCIVVGIDHGDKKRLVEYNPYFAKEFGAGEGLAYTEFLVKTLKPFIDKNYRTKTTSNNTAVAGSSMGALISTYAMLKYPTVFGSAGIFSPAYWIASSINDFAKKEGYKNRNNRFWFYGGGKEGFTMMADMQKMQKIISKKAINTVLTKDDNAQHNEAAWRKWFPEFYLWWMGK
jgi:predicted alpha/beta superfamily hydrolase